MAFASEMQKMQHDALVEMINKRNELVSKVNAVTGDRDALVENVENSDDETIANLREQIAELTEQFDAIVSERVEALLANSTEDAEALTAEVKEIDGTVKAGLSYYKKLYGDDAAGDLPKVERLKGTRSTGGGGGRRIRGYDVIVEVDGEETQFDNFASAAKHLGADTSDLQEQFFAKAGVEKLKDAPDEVTFSVSWTEVDEDENESTHTATVTAVRTGPSGVPAKAEAEPEADEVADVPAEDDLEAI